jgi:murein tripeptide amidase MpaA
MFLSCCLAFLAAGIQAQTDWARYRVWVLNEKAAKVLTDSPLTLFSEQVTLGGTDVVVGPGELPVLWRLGLPYEWVSNLPRADAWRHAVARESDTYHTAYLRLDGIIAQMEQWRTANPGIVTRQQIGLSVENRPIWSYRIYTGQGAPANSIVIHGGIHAREWISPPVAMYLADMMIRMANTSAIHRAALARTALYVIPVLNPDGYEFTWTTNRFWRKNRRRNNSSTFGVDLNRNFSVGFGGSGSSGNPASDTYRGPSAFSEPETRALRDHVAANPPLIGYIDYHSFSQLVLWPWGYTTAVAPDDGRLRFFGDRLESALDDVGLSYRTGPAAATLYVASGVTIDYFYATYGAMAYCIELRDTGTFGFLLPADQIWPTQQENWAGFERFFMDMAGPIPVADTPDPEEREAPRGSVG